MLKLKRFSSGQWFDYPKAPGVRLLIRPLQLSMGLNIRSKIRGTVATEVPDPRKKDKTISVLMEDVDTGKFSWEIFDYMLMDFEGIVIEDEKGEPVVATKEEIKRAAFDDEDIREFISQKSDFLRENASKKLEEEVKNSKSSQSG